MNIHKIKSLFVGIAVVISVTLQVRGAVDSSTLPSSLPMLGSRELFLNWIATNSQAVLSVGFRYTNVLGQMVDSFPMATGTNLTSYRDFTNYLAVYGSKYMSFLIARTGDMAIASSSKVKFYGGLAHIMPNGQQFECITIFTNMGYVSDITSMGLSQAPYLYAYAPIPLANLKKLTVDIGSNHDYFFTLTNGVSYYKDPPNVGFTPPKEYIMANMVILGEWYSTNGYRLRLTIGNDKGEMTYTQFGDALSSRLMLRGPALTVTSARGADVDVESSTDLRSWSLVSSYTANFLNEKILFVDTNQKRLFFRAKSH